MSDDNQSATPPAEWEESVVRRSSAYVGEMIRYEHERSSQAAELQTLGLRRLLARGAKLLRYQYSLELAFEHPHSMLDSEDILDLYKRGTRVRQLEIALGRKLIKGLDLKSSDALCSHVGANLLDVCYAELIHEFDHNLSLLKAGDWAGLLLTGFIPYEDYLELKESCPDGNPRLKRAALASTTPSVPTRTHQ